MGNLISAVDGLTIKQGERTSFPCIPFAIYIYTHPAGMQLSAISAHKDMPHPWVYQNIRNLQGVVRSTTDNTPLNVTLPPFLNDATKDYLVSHGYETSVIMEIMTASITSLGV